MSNELVGADGGEVVVGLKPDLQPDLQAEPAGGELMDAAEVGKWQGIEQRYGDLRDLANEVLAEAQMAGAFEEFSRTVRSSKISAFKENKLFRAMKGKKLRTGAELDGTWEGFCRDALGRSVDQVDRDIANVRAFGEEALEAMQRAGIGYRQFRELRQVPEGDRESLQRVALHGDKEALLDLAEELIARANKKVGEAEAQASATQELAQSLQERISDLRETASTKDLIIGELKTEVRRLQDGQAPDVRIQQDLMQHSHAMRVVLAQALAHLDQLQELIRRVELMEPPVEGTPEADAYRLGMRQVYHGLAEPLLARQYLFAELLDRLTREIEWRTLTPEQLEETRRASEAAVAAAHPFHLVK